MKTKGKFISVLAIMLAVVLMIGACGSSRTNENTGFSNPTRDDTTHNQDVKQPSEETTESSNEFTEPTVAVTTPSTDTSEPSIEVTEPTISGPDETVPEITAPDSTDPTAEITRPTVPSEEPVAHEHNYSKMVVAATCTKDGYTTYTCSCGDQYTGGKESATGHNWGGWTTTKEPTTTATGTAKRTCTKCSAAETKKLDKLSSDDGLITDVQWGSHAVYPGMPSHTHRSYKETIPGTCTTEGYTIYTCVDCGDTFCTDFTDGHQWSDWVTTKEPIASAPGKSERTCTACSEIETKVLEQLDPDYVYSYELYFIDDMGADVYSGVEKVVYLKTDYYAPTFGLKVNGESVLRLASDYDDVEYLDDSEYPYTGWEKVPGGYLCAFELEAAGTVTVELTTYLETIMSFQVNVLDFEVEQNKWIDDVIATQTNSSMNPKEKMDAIAAYLSNGQFRYLTNDGQYLLSLAAEPNSPWFRSMRWDSCTSPAVLELFAERIGGFEEINNCFDDYHWDTEEWKIYHHMTYVVYNGEKYYYSVCPMSDTGKVEPIEMIDFTNTSRFTRIG